MSYDEQVDRILATANQQFDRIVPDMLEARRSPWWDPQRNVDREPVGCICSYSYIGTMQPSVYVWFGELFGF